MTVQLELWHLISLLLAFFGCVAGFFKLLMGQINASLAARFKAQDDSLSEIKSANRTETEQWRRVERELLQLRADLPLQYVRREDYVRGQTVLEAKMDGLAMKIENMQLRGGPHVG